MNKYLIDKFQPQTLDGHPLVKWDRKTIIDFLLLHKYAKEEGWHNYSNETSPDDYPHSWKFSITFYLEDTPEYGSVNKKWDAEVYTQMGKIDWKNSINPYRKVSKNNDYYKTEMYNHYAWESINVVLSSIIDAANLEIPFNLLNWKMYYEGESIYGDKLKQLDKLKTS